MSLVPIIRSSLLKPFSSFMLETGIPVGPAFRYSRLPMESLEDSELVIPEKSMWQLLEYLRLREGIPDIGFQIVSRSHFYDIPAVAEQVGGSKTLWDLLENYGRAHFGQNNSPTYCLSIRGGNAIYARSPSPIDVEQWPIEQCAVLSMTNLVQLALGPDWRPLKVGLIYSGELLGEESRWLRDSEVLKGQQSTWISIPRNVLERPVSGLIANKGAGEAQTLPSDIGASVAACLSLNLGEPEVRLKRFCATVGVRPRTLQRWLNSQGDTFQGVLDSIRYQHAVELLESSELKYAEIGRILGYARPAAFTRAFNRWAGCPPSRFKKATSA